ncbi:DUF3618 domain-containing protein [Alienimonas californiensis]|uniref:Uncharacterized protein n=1 Tax=Alienimonas californiensis TaxID=2527989 RepID=A0A517PBX9_9PLAN|nr:DUF3618 domain-containing protein [Alienimonas californiensis]QDT16862.1 hypothetical protein CA12_29700 [Alienimonas californiensis]
MNTAAPHQAKPYADGVPPERAAERPDSPANPATPPAYPDHTSSGAIRADIARTRTEMDGTLDQLGERLRPSALIDDAAGFAKSWLGLGTTSAAARTTAEPVYEERVQPDGTVVQVRREGVVASGPADPFGFSEVYKTGSRLVGTLGDAIRENPVATAICATGLAYAFFEDPLKKSARRQYRRWTYEGNPEPRMYSGSYVDARTGLPYSENYGAGYRNPYAASGSTSSSSSSSGEGSWSDEAGHWYDAAGNQIAAAGTAVANALSGAVESVSHAFSSGASATSHAAGAAGRSVQRYAANTSRDVTVQAGRVSDAATGALLHVGSEAKDGTIQAANTTADAAGKVYDKATGAFLYAGSSAAEAARSTGRSVKVTSGKVYDATSEALLHAGSEAKDGVVKAGETFADAAGNVYHAATGAFLYAGSAAAHTVRDAGRSVKVASGNAYDAVTGALLHAGTEVKDGTYHAAEVVADAAGNGYHATTGALLYSGSAIADAVRSASSSISHFAEDAYHSAESLGHQALEKTVDGYEVTKDRFDRSVQENPLAVGLGFLAAGLLAGFCVPRTKTENRLMGASRDRLWDQAEHSAEAVLHQAKTSAAHAMGMTLDEMERQGLTPKDLVDKAAHLAQNAGRQMGQDISHAAKAEGLDAAGLKARGAAVANAAASGAQLAASEVADKAASEARNVEGQAESEAGKLKGKAQSGAENLADSAKEKARKTVKS